MTMRKGLVAIALIGLMTGFSGVVAAADEHSLEHVLVESAQSAADHLALAHHYRAKAAEARAEAAIHEKMGRTYAQGKATERARMQTHCQKIADSFKAQAVEYDEMASVHEAEAKRPAK